MRLTKTISIAALTTLAFAGPAMADRRTGLGGNILIEDRDDIFIFPQLVLKYKNMVGMDYNGSQGSGNGVLTFGKGKTAFGILVNRADAGQPLSPYSLDYELGQNGGMAPVLTQPAPGGSNFTAPSTIVDFVFGTKMGNKNLGFRVALGHGGNTTTAGGDDAEGDGQTVLRVGGGVTLPGISMRGDLGFDLNLGFGGDLNGGDDNASGLHFGLGGNARFYKKMTDTMDMGIIGALGFSQTNATNTSDGADSDTASRTMLNLLGGFGPVYHKGNTTVAGYGVVGLMYQATEPSTETDDDIQTRTEIWLPGFRIAFEHDVLEWLYFRSGMQYTWRLVSASDEPGDNTQSSAGAGGNPGDGDFGWNAGLGIKVGNFRFDGALSHAFLTNGPDMLGGNAAGTFVQSSATYTW